MLICKASRQFEAGVKPSSERAEAWKEYCEELVKAGVLLAAEGLYPSSEGIRLSYPVSGGKPRVTVGPFDEVQGLVAGFMMIEVETKEEAYVWAMRLPDPHGYGEGGSRASASMRPGGMDSRCGNEASGSGSAGSGGYDP
ncbi:YciI family protein [Cohnella sp. CFH 77786]|uniref:YciI family protein n=1 Tax=Cohnella sp. CFH 77786 TaxID=2662265 RepID=UPI002103751B|nr:YciI family protein [Cohnella sp. CFH 77786]